MNKLKSLNPLNIIQVSWVHFVNCSMRNKLWQGKHEMVEVLINQKEPDTVGLSYSDSILHPCLFITVVCSLFSTLHAYDLHSENCPVTHTIWVEIYIIS